MTKKVVLRLGVNDEKAKKKAMKAVSSASGIESLVMDMKEKKLTVVGAVDPVEVVGKLNKYWSTELLTVGPAKEPEKKEISDRLDDLLELYKKHYPYQREYYPLYTTVEENPNSCVIC